MKATSIREVQEWLSTLETLVHNKNCKSPAFLRPFHLITLAITLKKQNAIQIKIPEHLAGYASRMRLWEAAGITPPNSSKNEQYGNGKFLPVEPLNSRDKVYECASRLSNITTRANLDKQSRSSLDTSISELVDNCYAHAELTGTLHGLACAQFWANGYLAQIAIVDHGIGIRKSLEQAETPDLQKRVSKSNACEIATELGVTSKPTAGHAGYGLALTRQMIENNGGTLVVCSGQEWFVSTNKRVSSGKMSVDWKGTLIVCEFNTNQLLSTAEVYAQWPPVRGYGNDDFDF